MKAEGAPCNLFLCIVCWGVTVRLSHDHHNRAGDSEASRGSYLASSSPSLPSPCKAYETAIFLQPSSFVGSHSAALAVRYLSCCWFGPIAYGVLSIYPVQDMDLMSNVTCIVESDFNSMLRTIRNFSLVSPFYTYKKAVRWVLGVSLTKLQLELNLFAGECRWTLKKQWIYI